MPNLYNVTTPSVCFFNKCQDNAFYPDIYTFFMSENIFDVLILAPYEIVYLAVDRSYSYARSSLSRFTNCARFSRSALKTDNDS